MDCYVVTGGGRGVGRAVTERLLGDGAAVVIIERDPAAAGWAVGHVAADRLIVVGGDAADQEITERAADRAETAGRLAGSPGPGTVQS
jgi:NAD(P)-dependent dehydrogenase (short-subunit alcohol dehydrogenase family)